MSNNSTKKPKVANLKACVTQALGKGEYSFSSHARMRMLERDITVPEVLYVLRAGHHERGKDSYVHLHDDWNYSVVGKTVDNKKLRVIVSFERDTNMLIVTVIDLRE